MANFFQWNGSVSNGAAYTTSVRGTPIVVVSATLTATLTTDTTYTSSATNLLEFNSIMVQTILGSQTGAKTATTIFGAMSSGGTMVALYDKDTSAQMTTGSISSNRTQKFTGLTDYIGFSTTFSAGATAGSSFTITIQPLNL